jgi:uncharacterized protein YciI
MFIVLLRLSDASEVVTHLPGHREWLDQGFDDGVFVLTGGISDAGGGVVLATNLTLDDLTDRLAVDPFVVHGVVTPDIVAVDVTIHDPRLAFIAP